MSDSDRSTINLDTMSLEELHQLKQQQESQLQAYTARYSQLRAAAARLHASEQAVAELGSPVCKDKQVMVPLTSSLYVPGRIQDPTKVLVELGTGFFAETSTKECGAFFQRKMKLVDANTENVTQAIQASRQNMESIAMAMQGKLLEIRARQEGQRQMSTIRE